MREVKATMSKGCRTNCNVGGDEKQVQELNTKGQNLGECDPGKRMRGYSEGGKKRHAHNAKVK